MNHYYVYALLDHRKPGNFTYGDFVFKHKPFYIGKGHSDRAKSHSSDCGLEKANPHAKNIIKKIKKLNQIPLIEYLYVNLEEIESYNKEIEIIALIGLHNLTNILPGGQGRDRESMLGDKNPMFGTKRPKWIIDKMQEGRQKTNQNRTGKKLEEILGEEAAKKSKQKMSEKRKGKTWEEYFGIEKAQKIKQERSEQRKKHKHPQVVIDKMKESAKNPEVIAKKVNGILKYRQQKFDALFSANKDLIIDLIKKDFSDAEIKKRTALSRHQFKKIINILRLEVNLQS